ncbi:cell division protein FtsW [Friedmanniella endophytica]|uniref:Probable peptidoglycan glycosyltransferase FtsW n=1 Tax=Microlunatus kandeliicorticis TaxID=1759536 RepID=A0A7W3P5S8_9ACTN|nr:putative lipid II flippase FtsW [Microlunatus kandeliicorticis]MBA8794311.1 cell division protein FtsW [Microlunatus kandeliicorticis]
MTLTSGSPGVRGRVRGEGGDTDRLATRPETGRADVWGWVRAVLDRPMTSFHLVVAAAGLLLGLGVLMVLSASSVVALESFGDAYYYVKRQVVFLLVGLVGAVVAATLPPSRIRLVAWPALFLACVLLILTYTPLGVTVGGNRNWLRLGTAALQIQPSEFAKLALIVWAADVLARKEKLLDQPKHLLIPFLPVSAIVILLIVFQGDAGTAVVVAGIVAAILWIVGAPTRVLLGLGVGGGLGVVGLFVTSPNRMARLNAFLNPTHDVDGTNLQSTVATLAIASGGWWGLGLGASRQKWGSLPVAYSDYIFAVIGEELGLVGSLMVLLLFLVLGYAGIRIALRSTESFNRYVSAGITAWFMVQALINLGVVLRLMPIAGVPLPMVSYGGSALIANTLALGLLVSCARREPAALEALGARRAKHRPAMTTVVGSRGGRRR